MSKIVMDRSGEMEVFVRVVHHRALSAAARELGVTPSAVSKLIAKLEARVGAQLIARTSRAFRLTAEGEAFHDAALRVVRAIDDAEAEAALGGVVQGRLRINATIPFGRMHVAPLLPAYLALHPRLQVDLELTDRVVDLVGQRTDVAIRMGKLPDSSLVARKLGESRPVVCAAPSYLQRAGAPAAPADLARHDCLTFTFRRRPATWPFCVDGADVLQPVAGSVVVNNGEAMKDLTLAGLGVARLGLFHVAADLREGRLVPLLEAFNPGDLEEIYAVYLSGGVTPSRVRSFIDHLVQALARAPELQAGKNL